MRIYLTPSFFLFHCFYIFFFSFASAYALLFSNSSRFLVCFCYNTNWLSVMSVKLFLTVTIIIFTRSEKSFYFFLLSIFLSV